MKPFLEILEDRTVPSQCFWVGNISTDAANPANWSINGNNATPGAMDDVFFGPVGGTNNPCILSTDLHVHSLSFDFYNGKVDLNGHNISVQPLFPYPNESSPFIGFAQSDAIPADLTIWDLISRDVTNSGSATALIVLVNEAHAFPGLQGTAVSAGSSSSTPPSSPDTMMMPTPVPQVKSSSAPTRLSIEDYTVASPFPTATYSLPSSPPQQQLPSSALVLLSTINQAGQQPQQQNHPMTTTAQQPTYSIDGPQYQY
jgi:hypothetical protein